MPKLGVAPDSQLHLFGAAIPVQFLSDTFQAHAGTRSLKRKLSVVAICSQVQAHIGSYASRASVPGPLPFLLSMSEPVIDAL
jgi:hypothetical protein